MSAEITELLHRVRAGDAGACEELIPLLYPNLHRIAGVHLSRERAGHTLQPTALVNEAYLRLFKHNNLEFADRVHFLAIASRVMRRILVDYARKRVPGRDGETLPLSAADESATIHVDLLDLDRAVDELTAENPTIAEIVEMHYFGGMTAAESAEATGRSIYVVQHQLRFAQAWLRRRLSVAKVTEQSEG